MKTTLIILAFIFCFSSYAKCLSDIYRAGFETNSVAYDTKENDNSFATIATTSSVGLKFGKLWYCPRERREYLIYTRLTRLAFEEKPSAIFSQVPDSELLISVGAEVKQSFKPRWEWIADTQIRQDIGFSANYTTLKLIPEKIINLKAMGGVRYFIYSRKKWDLSGTGKLGLLWGPQSGVDLGSMMSLNLEALRRIGSKSSIKFDLFFDRYSQQFENLQNIRKEVGLRSNLVFRF